MFDFDGLDVDAPPPPKKAASSAAAPAAVASGAGAGAGVARPGPSASSAAAAINGAGAVAADAMIAKLKQAAWDAEEAERPPPPPPEPEPQEEEEEVIDAPAAAGPAVEAEPPRLSREAAEAEHAALIERLKQAAVAFNDSDEVQAQRNHVPESNAAMGSAFLGRSCYDAPYVPSEEERAPVQAEDDGRYEPDNIRDYSGPVANAIAFAREMRAAREARGREAAAKPKKEVKEVEPEVPFELTRDWAPETALFRISGRVLPMHLERAGMTPHDVARIWEQAWGIAYASRLRFEAQPDAPTKWLNVREDELPPPPTVTRLDGKPPILDAVALALTQRDEELFMKSFQEGEERRKEEVGHGGKWVKKSETFRWSAPTAYDEDATSAGVPIWPPMEPPPMPEGRR